METLTFERHITNKKEKVKWEFENVSSLTYIEYWDNHGNIYIDNKKTYSNVHVKISERSWNEFGKKWEIYVAYVNGEELEAEITSVKGDNHKLIIQGCIGAG